MRRRGASDLSSEGSFDAFLGTVTKNGLGMLVLVAMASTFSSQLTLGQDKFKRSLGTPLIQLAPRDAKSVAFECRGARVVPLEFTALFAPYKAFFTAFDLGQNMEQLAQQYNAKKLGNDYFTFEFKAHSGEGDFPNEPAVLIRPRPSVGETFAEADKPGSAFRKRLLTIDKNRDVVFLGVRPDSFELFRELREVLQKDGYQVGWLPDEKPILLPHPKRLGPGTPFKG